MNSENEDIKIISSEILNAYTSKSTIKVKGGSYINVKSIYDRQIPLKDVLFTATVNSINKAKV